MREILFRCFDDINKIMNYFSLLNIHCGCYHPYHWKNSEGTACEINNVNRYPYEIMQHMGREDKNGKKIFEKDILLGRFNLDKVEDHIFLQLSEEEKRTQSKIFVVEDIFYLYTNQVPDDLEVIGNVFENSNLLDNNS